jgi:phytoene dehydrogenase-like protein
VRQIGDQVRAHPAGAAIRTRGVDLQLRVLADSLWHHRPDARSSLPGLYLAGAWTFPGPGFSGAMHSGYRTAGLIIEDVEGRPASAL